MEPRSWLPVNGTRPLAGWRSLGISLDEATQPEREAQASRPPHRKECAGCSQAVGETVRGI